jgi:hypothetical protein
MRRILKPMPSGTDPGYEHRSNDLVMGWSTRMDRFAQSLEISATGGPSHLVFVTIVK